MIANIGRERSRTLRRFELEQPNGAARTLADSTLLDPEHRDEIFEPFAKGGLFRKRSRLRQVKKRITQRDEKE